MKLLLLQPQAAKHQREGRGSLWGRQRERESPRFIHLLLHGSPKGIYQKRKDERKKKKEATPLAQSDSLALMNNADHIVCKIQSTDVDVYVP